MPLKIESSGSTISLRAQAARWIFLAFGFGRYPVPMAPTERYRSRDTSFSSWAARSGRHSPGRLQYCPFPGRLGVAWKPRSFGWGYLTGLKNSAAGDSPTRFYVLRITASMQRSLRDIKRWPGLGARFSRGSKKPSAAEPLSNVRGRVSQRRAKRPLARRETASWLRASVSGVQ